MTLPMSLSFYIKPKHKKSNSVIFQFIWRNKTHYLKKSELVKEYKHGGVKALDFETLVVRFRMTWLKAFLASPNSMCFHIPPSIFERFGGLDFFIKCDFELSKVPFALSQFHKQILHYWKMIFSHNFTPHNSVLWNNRSILSNQKSLFNTKWFNKGIIFIIDIMDSNGIFLEYQSFIYKYVLISTYRDDHSVIKAVPLALARLIQNIVTNSDITPILPKLLIKDYKI